MKRPIIILISALSLLLAGDGISKIQAANTFSLDKLEYAVKGDQLILAGTILYNGTRQGLAGFNSQMAEQVALALDPLLQKNPGVERLSVRLDISNGQQAVPYFSADVSGKNMDHARVKEQLLKNGSFVSPELVAKLLQLPEGVAVQQEETAGDEIAPLPVKGHPTVISSLQKGGVNFPVKPITFTFSEPMDRVSVEEAFATNPVIKGEMDWHENTLYYTPTEIKGHTSYQITIKKDAKSLKGKTLFKDYQFSFTTGNQYTYQRDIVPIINRFCVQCHNINEAGPASAVKLFPYAEIMKYVTPGNGQSKLVQSFHPKEEAVAEAALVRSWIVNDNAVEQ